MGIERHVLGGFTADPQPSNEKQNQNPDRVKEGVAFLNEYSLQEPIVEKFKEIYGEDKKMSLEMQENLTKHLVEEFQNTKGDKEYVKEMILDEVVKFFKMSK